MPHTTDVARMIRMDVVAARQEWIDASRRDVDELTRREQSDFLNSENAEGEKLVFHALRHTCEAWLAMTGAHPKAVQSVMRHSTIRLTMDTYGHLFPGQEADTVARLPAMMRSSEPLEIQATGTTGNDRNAAYLLQRTRDSVRIDAKSCEQSEPAFASLTSRTSLEDATLDDVCDSVRQGTKVGPARLELATNGL
ncbi:MAG: tyrosine-type recombinase/integrase [Planctomycetaceae bacterium]|nr:tyrosine-type recombinase/integrase [Planctomycetaceae bacterium]